MEFRAICPCCSKQLVVCVYDAAVECPWCHTVYRRKVVIHRAGGHSVCFGSGPPEVGPPGGKAPPLGVEPYTFWRERVPDPHLKDLAARYEVVAAAVTRYRGAGLRVPAAWLSELGVL